MNGVNKVILLGNLGADPDFRETDTTSVLTWNLACTETWLDARKQRQERTEWVRVVAFGRRAEGLSRVLRKGDRIFVEGSLRTTRHERNGETAYTTAVIASNVVLSGGARRPSDEEPRERVPDRTYHRDTQPPAAPPAAPDHTGTRAESEARVPAVPPTRRDLPDIPF
ncbi:single-stranded DNA-binding protein [Pendulispora albinea]|uniref:Single-stranded DNA-binding protein n=1 Tax=Pendulispora albinea TaxID=2741071 RepID=A0ABZ2LRQ3_9BACT